VNNKSRLKLFPEDMAGEIKHMGMFHIVSCLSQKKSGLSSNNICT